MRNDGFKDLKTQKLQTLSQSSVRYILAVARQIINFAIDNELVKNYTNPIGKGRVGIKTPSNAKKGFLSREQAALLLEALKESDNHHDAKLYELTVLLLHTGARFSEVASLMWSDVDFDRGQIYFKPTKNGNERHIAMTPLVKELLHNFSNEDQLLFPSNLGTIIQQMPNRWQKIVDEIIPDNTPKKSDSDASANDVKLYDQQRKNRITVHSLRHTHASWMVNSGKFSLLEIKEQLGHKTLQMTERYAHLIPQDRHDKTNEVFG